jgi:hypothetical protein
MNKLKSVEEFGFWRSGCFNRRAFCAAWQFASIPNALNTLKIIPLPH